MRCMADYSLGPANSCLFSSCFLFLHLQLNTVFCHGEAIPLLGLWGFRLVSLVQSNEHETFTPPPYAKSREELALVLVLIVWWSRNTKVLDHRDFTGDQHIYWASPESSAGHFELCCPPVEQWPVMFSLSLPAFLAPAKSSPFKIGCPIYVLALGEGGECLAMCERNTKYLRPFFDL